MQKHRKSLKITAFDGNNSPCFKSCICFKLGHSTQSKKNINLFDNTIIVPPLIYQFQTRYNIQEISRDLLVTVISNKDNLGLLVLRPSKGASVKLRQALAMAVIAIFKWLAGLVFNNTD